MVNSHGNWSQPCGTGSVEGQGVLNKQDTILLGKGIGCNWGHKVAWHARHRVRNRQTVAKAIMAQAWDQDTVSEASKAFKQQKIAPAATWWHKLCGHWACMQLLPERKQRRDQGEW